MERFNLFALLKSSFVGSISLFLLAGGFSGCDTSVQSNGPESVAESFTIQAQASLVAEDDGYSFKASNGYEITLTGIDSFAPSGGSLVAEVVSPAGETMTLDMSHQDLGDNGSVSTLQLDGSTTLDLAYASPQSSNASEPEWESFRIQRGGMVIEAQALPSDIDDNFDFAAEQEAAIELYGLALEESHSKDFYSAAGLAYNEFLQALGDQNLDIACAAGIIGTAGALLGGAAACAGTSGLACWGAGLVFVAAATATAAACS